MPWLTGVPPPMRISAYFKPLFVVITTSSLTSCTQQHYPGQCAIPFMESAHTTALCDCAYMLQL